MDEWEKGYTLNYMKKYDFCVTLDLLHMKICVFVLIRLHATFKEQVNHKLPF